MAAKARRSSIRRGEGRDFASAVAGEAAGKMVKRSKTGEPIPRGARENGSRAVKKAKKIVPIAFCADAHYGTYLPVVLQSVIDHASDCYQYHIIIFDCGINAAACRAVAAQCAAQANFSYEIKQIGSFLEKYGQRFHERLHYTRAMYGRLFIPELCGEYERIIYTDIDVVFERDIAELMEADLGEAYIGAVTELSIEYERLSEEKTARYMHDILGLETDIACIYSGLLVFNVKQWRDAGITEKTLSFLAGKKLRCPDQDALTAICRDKIMHLGQDWTCVILKDRIERFAARVKKGRFPKLDALFADWQSACISGKAVIHYNGSVKPWHSPHLFLAEKWWHYARETAFYAHYNYCLLRDMTLRDCPTKIYRFFGIPFLVVKKTPLEKKYLLGKYRIAKKEYRGCRSVFYIFGIKIFSVGAE